MKDPLRRRFGNALQWYNRLQQSTNEYVDSVIQNSRQANQLDTEDSEPTTQNDTSNDSLFTPENSPSPTTAEEDQRPGKRGRREPAGSARIRPSEYLRARCPICFGGSFCFSEGCV